MIIKRILLLLWTVLFTQATYSQAIDTLCGDIFEISRNGNTYKVPICTNFGLQNVQPAVNRIVVTMHGSSRTGPEHFSFIEEAASLVPGASDSSLLIVPHFLEAQDVQALSLGPEYLFWQRGGNGWKYGYDSDSTTTLPRQARISSFTIVDEIILQAVALAPNVRQIVVVGHSGGGQFVGRYAAGNTIENQIGANIPFRYVAANPSTWLYFTPERWVPGTQTQFAVPDAATQANCPNHDRYKFGLTDLDSCNYLIQVGPAAIRSQFQNREVAILLGELDNDPNDPTMDQTCKADLEGAHRRQRGELYFEYLQHHYGPSILQNHYREWVQGVGHSSRRMFISEPGLNYIFRDNVTVSRDPRKDKGLLKIYPNPANSHARIEVPNAFIEEASLLTLAGEVLGNWQAMPGSHRMEIGLEGHSAGLYILQAQTSQGKIAGKIWVQ